LVAQVSPVRDFPFGWGTWPTSSSNPDKGGIPFFCIQDPVNFDVLAFFDKSGKLVEQYAWDPYGTPAMFETDADVMPVNRVGHHGIFFDRIDTQTIQWGEQNTPHFEVGAYLVGHVRNRTYWPGLGRWGQRDPNGTGATPVTGGILGVFESAITATVDLESISRDGMNRFGYLRSNPNQATDPHGMFMIAVQAVMMGHDAWSDAESTLAEAQQGLITSFSVADMLSEYGMQQSMDADWATDWSASDDAYSGAVYIPDPTQSDLTHFPLTDFYPMLRSSNCWGLRYPRAAWSRCRL